MRIRDLILGVVSLVVLTHAAEAQKAKAPRRDRDKISAEEISEKPTAQNAYDLIKVLRSQWFTARGPTSITMGEVGVVVYRDGSKLGSVDELKTIPSDQIKELRHLSSSEATMRFGTDHPSGAIEVETKQ